MLPFFDAPSGGSFIHFLATLVRLLGPGGVRSIVAESLLLKHQFLLLTRCVLGGCALRGSDRFSSTVSIRQTGCLHPDQHILNATQNSLCRVVDRRRGRCACRARKCRSVTIMARVLAEKTESSFAPSHSFRRCTRFWRGTPVFRHKTRKNYSLFLPAGRYCCVARSMKPAIWLCRLTRSWSCKYIMWPAL